MPDIFDEVAPARESKAAGGDVFDELTPEAPAAPLTGRALKREQLIQELAAERKRTDKLNADEAELARQERSIGNFTGSGMVNIPGKMAATLAGYGEHYQPTKGPLVPITVPADDPSVMAGVGRVGASLLSGLTDPDVFVTLPAFGGGALPKLLGVTPMAQHLPEQVTGAGQMLNNPEATAADVTEAVLNPVATAAMIAATGKGPKPREAVGPILPDVDTIAREQMAPGTVRPPARQAWAPAEVEAPGEMVSAGRLPFDAMRRFGYFRLKPVEVLDVFDEVAAETGTPKVSSETRGKMGFGAEAPTLNREALGMDPVVEGGRNLIRDEQGRPAPIEMEPVPAARPPREMPEAPRYPEPLEGQPYEANTPPETRLAPRPGDVVGEGGGKVVAKVDPGVNQVRTPDVEGAGSSPGTGSTSIPAEHPFKRPSPAQVGQPLASGGKLKLPDGRYGASYYIPGFEEYRTVLLKPEGNKAKGNKVGWRVVEATTGLEIAQPKLHLLEDTPQGALALAQQKMNRVGKSKLDELISQKQPQPETPNPKPETAPVAEAKMQERIDEVRHPLAVEGEKIGQRRQRAAAAKRQDAAKEIKSELVQRLEEAIAKLPADGVGEGVVTIDIPGDGSFKVRNHKVALETTLAKAKGLATGRSAQAVPVGPAQKYSGVITKANKAELGFTGSKEKRSFNEREASLNLIRLEQQRAAKTVREAAKQDPGLIAGTAAESWADGVLRGGGTHLGPDVIAAYMVKGAAILERGVTSFAKWAKAMEREHGPEIRPHLREIFEGAQQALRTQKSDGGKLVQRKLAARAMTSPEVPAEHQQRMGTDSAAFHERQNTGRVEEDVARMSPSELASVPFVAPDGQANIWVASQLELYKRLVAEGQPNAAWSVIDNAMKRGTSMGQLVNQFKMLSGATPDGVMVMLDRRLAEAGYDPVKPTKRIQVRVLAGQSIKANVEWKNAEREAMADPTPAKVEAAIETRQNAIEQDVKLQTVLREYQPRAFADVLSTILQGNLLAPISLAANTFGNLNNLLVRGQSRGVAAVLDAVDAELSAGPRTSAVAPVRTLRGALQGAREAAGPAKQTLWHGASDLELSKVDAKLGLRPLVALRQLLARSSADVPLKAGKVPLGDTFTRLLEATPFSMNATAMLRVLAGTDLPFRQAALGRLVEEALTLKTMNSGVKFTPEQRRQAVQYPELFLDRETVKRIDYEALKAVYQNPNVVSQFILGRVSQANPWARFVFRTIAPYVTTPVNVTAEILSYVPGIAHGNAVRHALRKDWRNANLAAGKALVGMTVTGAGVWLYQKGLLMPMLEDQDEANKGRMAARGAVPPGHLNLSGLNRAMTGGDSMWQAGDRTVDVMRGGGVAGALVLNAANTLRRLETQPDQADALGQGLEILKDGVVNTMGYAVNQSYTRGIADALDAARGEKLDQWFMNYADGLGAIALPNTLKNIARATREYKPEVRGDSTDKTLENLLRNKLGAFGAAENLPLKRDLFGRPVRETPEGSSPWLYHMLDVTKAQRVPNDPVGLELYTLWRRTGSTKVLPEPPDRTFTLANKTFPLTRAQESRLQELVGSERLRIFETARETDDWSTITDQQRLARLARIWAAGAQVGNAKFFMEHREELEAKPTNRGFEIRR